LVDRLRHPLLQLLLRLFTDALQACDLGQRVDTEGDRDLDQRFDELLGARQVAQSRPRQAVGLGEGAAHRHVRELRHQRQPVQLAAKPSPGTSVPSAPSPLAPASPASPERSYSIYASSSTTWTSPGTCFKNS